MTKVLVTESHLEDIADAIREKLDVTDLYRPRDMAPAILSIPQGTTSGVTEAYVVGSTPYASDWLSDESGGSPITPKGGELYVIVSGSLANEMYRWDGTQYQLVSRPTEELVAMTVAEVLEITGQTAYYPDGDEDDY